MDRLIAIIGPTAVGKTKVSIDLARLLDTEIISGDSMLIYRGMDIGTAKPDAGERRGIPHHLIDIRDPAEDYSVAEFQKMAAALVRQINSKGKIPIIAGGTGLYLKALLEGYRFSEASGESTTIRNRLAHMAEQYGNSYLHQQLAVADPEAAARLHPNDLRRIIRALEVHITSGKGVSQEKEASGQLVFDAVVVGLSMDRAALYSRINERVEQMIASGLVEEVDGLLKRGVPRDAQSMKGIGYKEIVSYLRGEVEFNDAVEKIKQATRNFAKRQLTWYNKMPYIWWVKIEDFPDYNEMMAYIYNHIAGKFHLK